MNDLDETLSNYEWFKQQILEAKSHERLMYLAGEIAYCQWEKEDWTQDEVGMITMRELWKRKHTELKSTK